MKSTSGKFPHPESIVLHQLLDNPPSVEAAQLPFFLQLLSTFAVFTADALSAGFPL